MWHQLFATSQVSAAEALKLYSRRDDRIEVTVELRTSGPSVIGYHDKDLLIYAVSVWIQRHTDTGDADPTVRFAVADYLAATGTTSRAGHAYARVKAAVDRLTSAIVRTNLRSGDHERYESQALVSRGVVETLDRRQGSRSLYVEITFSQFLLDLLRSGAEYLAYHPGYFRLSPTCKRLYEIAKCEVILAVRRNHPCLIPLLDLHLLANDTQDPRKFKQEVLRVVREDLLPEFRMSLDVYRPPSEPLRPHRPRLNQYVVRIDPKDRRIGLFRDRYLDIPSTRATETLKLL